MSYNPVVNLPVGLAVQKGLIPNFVAVQKFGLNTAVSTAFETVWTNGALYSYPSTHTTAVATSSNTGDDNDSTVHVYGLDENFDFADEIITVGGAASSTTFIRVFRSHVVNANTGTANVGIISITVNSIAVAVIPATYGQSLQAVYTIPRNHIGYLMAIDVGTSKQKEVEVKLMQKPINGNTFQTKALVTTFGTPFSKEYTVPEILTEKSDVELRAKADATTSISGGFQLILENMAYNG